MHLGLKRRCLAFMLFWAFVMLSASVQSADIVAQAETPQEELVPEVTDDVVVEEQEPDATPVVEEETRAAESEAQAAATETEAAAAFDEEASPYVVPDELAEGEEIVSYLLPYRKRRLPWGSLVNIGWSGYNPSNYNPDFVLDSFDDYYGRAETPLIEFTVSAKKNFSLLSVTLDFGGGYYSNNGADNSTLTLIPLRAGVGLALDTLFDEPYVVPYGSVGAYSVLYRESISTQAVNGNTQVGLYYTGGLRFQLDWVDTDGDYASYDESGMENTFLYIEARSFLVPGDNLPDLGSSDSEPLNIGAGFSMEF